MLASSVRLRGKGWSFMTKRFLTTLMVAAIASAGFASAAMAAEITFTGNYAGLNGTGNGPIQGVLSLQQQSSDTFEYGFSGWSQTSGVGGTLFGTGASPAESWSSSTSQVHKATTPSGYFAQSVGTLGLAGIDATNLAIAFQVNVQGQNDQMRVRTFDVVFIHADGSLVDTLTYTPDGHSLAGSTIATDPTLIGNGTSHTTDDGILPGVGQGSSGWLYDLNLATVLAADPNFFTNSGNRIGMNVPQFSVGTTNNFDPVNDGSDNFFFTTVNTPVPVPVPAAAWTGISALAGLGLFGKLRKKLSRD